MRHVSAVLLALALVTLALPAPAEATIFRGRAVARPYYRPAYSGARMPGWDWWRIYPYSPYNYGRNPYNPIIVPYPYPYVVPQPYPYPVYSTPTYTTSASLIPVPPVPAVPAVPTLRTTGSVRAR